MGVSAKNEAVCSSYCRVSLTVVLLSCIQVNDVHVFQCLTFSDTQEREGGRESATDMLLDQKKTTEEEKKRSETDRDIQCIIL